MKRIDVTCGYRVEYSNGDIYYYGGETDNGVCYKDLDAWESGEGVCYISEGEFSEAFPNEWVYILHNGDEFFNTREDILDWMSEYLAGCDVKMIEQYAENVLQTCDWQHPATLMEETDWDEVMREVYKEGTAVYWLDPAGETSQVYEIYSEVGPEMVKLSNDYSECEALLCEVYRKSDKLCPHCGGPLYHEKYDNTMDHYPYFCPECDENFFEFEAR